MERDVEHQEGITRSRYIEHIITLTHSHAIESDGPSIIGDDRLPNDIVA